MAHAYTKYLTVSARAELGYSHCRGTATHLPMSYIIPYSSTYNASRAESIHDHSEPPNGFSLSPVQAGSVIIGSSSAPIISMKESFYNIARPFIG
jgi:hypothetical protein